MLRAGLDGAPEEQRHSKVLQELLDGHDAVRAVIVGSAAEQEHNGPPAVPLQRLQSRDSHGESERQDHLGKHRQRTALAHCGQWRLHAGHRQGGRGIRAGRHELHGRDRRVG